MTTLSIALIASGCSQNNQEITNTDTSTKELVVEEAKNEDTKSQVTFLQESIGLLGQTHEESNSSFEGGEELYSADGEFLIGRKYDVQAFGIDTKLYTSMNTQGLINSITVHLGEDNFDQMQNAILEELGQASEINDVPSEGGATYAMWTIDQNFIYLYKGYGTVDLQLIMPDQLQSSQMDADLVAQLPQTIQPILAESTPYPLLRDYIIDAYEIPEDYYATSKYYYNYVDFNGDGQKEIFAVVMGPYTSGTGGSSAFIAFEYDNKIQNITNFTLIHTPIIISQDTTKGMNDIIAFKRGGGSEPSWVKLTSTGEGQYCSINDGETIDTLDGISGQAIIANDLLYDMDHSLFMTLE